MFVDFFFYFCGYGFWVIIIEWLILMKVMVMGFMCVDFSVFYYLVCLILVKKELDFDIYDCVFVIFFMDFEDQFDIDDEVLQWFVNLVLLDISDEDCVKFEVFDFEMLWEQFFECFEEQNECYDGGNKWVGIGGMLFFGYGGEYLMGICIGGGGGGCSVVQVVELCCFCNLCNDCIFDICQIGVVLWCLCKFNKDDGFEEFDFDLMIDESVCNGGEIDFVFGLLKCNKIKFYLMIDVGGLMDLYMIFCECLFSVVYVVNYFKKFELCFFYNCFYEKFYMDIL